MNQIKLKGYIKDIQDSHEINGIEYCKANIVTKRDNSKEDILNLRFKKFTNKYTENDEVNIVGNVRSYSKKTPDGKNKVDIYVFTYFDTPEESDDTTNSVTIDGRICKAEELRTLTNGKKNIHFILANNLQVNEGTSKLNSYIPCIAWGKTAKEIAKLPVNTKLNISGRLQSREYKKRVGDGEFEIKVAHELYVESFEVVE